MLPQLMAMQGSFLVFTSHDKISMNSLISIIFRVRQIGLTFLMVLMVSMSFIPGFHADKDSQHLNPLLPHFCISRLHDPVTFSIFHYPG